MRSAILTIVIAVSAAIPVAVSPQAPQAQGLPPPSFGTGHTVGTDLDFFEMRRFRDWQLNATVLVPTSEIQGVLLSVMRVVNPAAASAAVTIAFVLQERAELIGRTIR